MENWLSRLAPNTAKNHGYVFESWMRWMKENGGDLADASPQDLIVFQLGVSNSERFHILDLIQRYVSGKLKLPKEQLWFSYGEFHEWTIKVGDKHGFDNIIDQYLLNIKYGTLKKYSKSTSGDEVYFGIDKT